MQYTLAAVNTFSDPDSYVLEESYGTLRLCKYLSANGIQIVDAKWITDVVRMVPFKYTQQETNFLEGKCWELTTLWVVRLDNSAELKVTDPKEQQGDVEEEETEDKERRDRVD